MNRAFLAAALSLTAFAAAAVPHKEIAPLPREAVQAVRAAQQGQPDPLTGTLERQLKDVRQIAERGEQVAERPSVKTSRDAKAPTALAGPRAEASAKRRELRGLKAAAVERLDHEERTWRTRGDDRRARQVRELKRKLSARFDMLDQDLDTLAKADAVNLAARSERAAQRLRDWAAARPLPPLPHPNWQRAEPQLPVEQPKAKFAPRFVADAWWLMQQRLASRDGFVKVALRATPAEAGACGYTSTDLAQTAEAPKAHADIVALAQQLDYDPVRMFEWINQNIAFEPYYGSLKGGLATLWSKSGGATDQASLLIALLRAANIPARYVRGNITVLDNTPLGANGRAARWIGTKGYEAARVVLASNGNPAASVFENSSDQAIGVNLAHVWVEACLPYAAYRGTGLDDSGHRWIPLDPSYKEHRYQAGINVDGTFDFNYGDWLASRLDAQGRYRLPQEAFEDAVETHVKTKAPDYANNTLADVPYKSEIKRQRFDILPIVPPYEVWQYTSWSGVAGESAETAALPDRHRYRLQVAVRNKSGSSDPLAGNLLSQKTFNLADLATGRLTLSFKGATATDQTAFDTWFNAVDPAATPTCAATVAMVPVLKLEGVDQTYDAGSGTTALCSTDNVLHLKVTLAERTVPVSETRYTNIAAANLHALHAYAWHTSDTYLTKRTALLLANLRANLANPNADRDGIEGEFLNIAAAKYSRYVADASRQAGRLFGESGTLGVSLGLTAAQVKVNYLFDLPYGLYRKGFFIDWPGGIYTGTRLDTPSSTDRRAFKLAGFAHSAYEAYLWHELASLDAVSTTRGLQFAKEQNIEILQINTATDWTTHKCKLTNTCSSGALNTNPTGTNYSASHVSQIETQYVNNGFKLTLPRRLIQYPDAAGWRGAAFYAENLSSSPAQASFPINAYAGGVTVEAAPASTGGSGAHDTGSAAGGYAASAPLGSLYNPALGTGIQADPHAPLAFQNQGVNGYQTALGWGTGTSVSGDPVNMVTGNLIHRERDVAIKGRGGLPIVFERWYNSKGAKDGPLGFGWTHSFNHRLRFYGVESGVAKVSWTDGTGAERFFSTPNHTSGNIAVGATFAGTAGVYATVQRLSGGSYRLTERSGLTYLFESVNAGTGDTGLAARLLSITDRNGNTLTLSYTPATACTGASVCTVTDSLGRALTFSYTNGRISQISDWSGRQWRYEYDAGGDLVTFKNPLAVAGSQAPLSYQYYSAADGAKLAHALKRYTLPRGNGMHFAYTADGRVLRHTPFGVDGVLKDDHATAFAWSAFRREARQTDALGQVRVFLFDAHGNPLSITDEAGAKTQYTYFGEAGRTHLRRTRTDPMGLVTTYAYDAAGNLTDLTLPSGRTVQALDHTAFGQPKRVKDADGHWTLHRYDAAGNRTDAIRLRAGVVPVADSRPANADILAWTQHQADSVGNPVKTRRLRDWTGAGLGDANAGLGPSLETAWDSHRLNPTSLTRRGDLDGTPASLETEVYGDFQHDSLGRTTRGPDAAWYGADIEYDALDRPIKSPDGRGQQWQTVYDANGNPVFVGLTVAGAYRDGHYAAWDDLDRPERSVDYAGGATLRRHDALGHLSAVTGPDGDTLGFDRDPIGRITGAYDQEGHRVSLSRDAAGRPRSRTDPNNLTTAYAYHHASQDGRLKTTTYPKVSGQAQGRAVEVAAYDGHGRPTRINTLAADGSLRDSYRFYDALGRLTRSVGPQTSASDPNRPVTCYVYTVLGDVKEIWAGATTDTASPTCTLDGVTVTKQLARSYDDWGRPLSETDALGKTWTWTWNRHGELVTSQSPVQAAAGQSTTYAYGQKGQPGEVQGQLKQRTLPGANGHTLTTSRNALGLATRVETKNGAGGLVVAYDYSYDPAQRLTTVTDARGNKTLTYTWTPGGRLAQVRDSDGYVASFAYDAVGRLATITAPNGENLSFVWDAGGRLIERRLNTGLRTTQSWFEDGNLKDRKNLYGAATLTSHAYTLDAQGRRATHAENIGGSTKSWSYLYDNLDRLTSASDGTAETYAYDLFGNRRSKTKAGTTTAYLYDPAHRLSEIRSGSDSGALIGAAIHDADGHLTKLCEGPTTTQTTGDCTASGSGATTLALVWNALDHLTSATRTGANAVAESYQYDDQGRRISKSSGATTTSYLYDGDQIHAEWAGSISGMPAAVYVHGVGADDPVLRLTGNTSLPSATQAAYLEDGLGSVVGTVSPTGTLTASQRFDAWGNRIGVSGTIPQYGYSGREPDATALVYYRARYYHAGLGQFASRDPMGMADSISPYAYVANNPVNYVDPTGEIGVVGGLIGGGAELAGQYFEAGLNGTPFVPDYSRIAVATGAGAAGVGLVTAGNRLFQGATMVANAGRILVGASTEMASNAGQAFVNGDDISLRGTVVSGFFGGASAGVGDLAANAYLRSPATKLAAQESNRLRRIADSRTADGLPRPSRAEARFDRASIIDNAVANAAAFRSEWTAGSIAFTGGVVNRDGYFPQPSAQSLSSFTSDLGKH